MSAAATVTSGVHHSLLQTHRVKHKPELHRHERQCPNTFAARYFPELFSHLIEARDQRETSTCLLGEGAWDTLRLAGRGLPRPNGVSGDLLVIARIVLPKTMTERELELFKELAAGASFSARAELL